MRPALSQSLPWLTRLAGLIYVGYALAKLADPTDFLKAVHGYDILPTQPSWLLNTAGIALPWIELLGGLSLLLGPLRRGSGLVLAGLLMAFTTAILLRSLSLSAEMGGPWLDVAFDCGCGTGVVIAWQKILGNLLLLCGTLCALHKKS